MYVCMYVNVYIYTYIHIYIYIYIYIYKQLSSARFFPTGGYRGVSHTIQNPSPLISPAHPSTPTGGDLPTP